MRRRDLGPLLFGLFVVVFIVGGNLVAWHFQIHVRSLFGYCSGYGC